MQEKIKKTNKQVLPNNKYNKLKKKGNKQKKLMVSRLELQQFFNKDKAKEELETILS